MDAAVGILIEQAETVEKTTKLMFICLSISATCSAFRMNVKELAHGPPPL